MLRPIELLVVEDNPADAELLRVKLKKAQVSIHLHVIDNGEDAIAFLRKQGAHHGAPTPDLVLLDLNLPGIHGREVLRRMKQDDTLAVIPVVVMTSSEAEDDVVKSYRAGASAYVRKAADLAGYSRIVKGLDDFWFGLVRYPTRIATNE